MKTLRKPKPYLYPLKKHQQTKTTIKSLTTGEIEVSINALVEELQKGKTIIIYADWGRSIKKSFNEWTTEDKTEVHKGKGEHEPIKYYGYAMAYVIESLQELKEITKGVRYIPHRLDAPKWRVNQSPLGWAWARLKPRPEKWVRVRDWDNEEYRQLVIKKTGLNQ